MSDTKLLPCPNPWCTAATPPKRVLTNYHMEFGHAIRCECGVIGPNASTAAKAIAAWNTRPAPVLTVASGKKMKATHHVAGADGPISCDSMDNLLILANQRLATLEALTADTLAMLNQAELVARAALTKTGQL